MRSAIIVCLAFCGTALAEPIPKESEAAKIEKVWGKLVDEGGGTKTKLEGEKLLLTLPPGERVVLGGGKNAKMVPYLFKEIDDDFEAMAKLIKHSIPDKAISKNEVNPLAALGLIVVYDTNTMVFFNRSFPSPGSSQFRALCLSPKYNWPTSGEILEDETQKPFTIRLTRKGNNLRFDYTTDTQKKPWVTLQSYGNLTLPAGKVKVGVYAEHSVNAETTAVFEGFAITKPKK